MGPERFVMGLYATLYWFRVGIGTGRGELCHADIFACCIRKSNGNIHASANTCYATTETSCKLEWCPILRKVHPGTIYSHISQRVFPSSILLLLCVLLWMPTWNWLTKKKSSKGTSSNVLEFWRLRSSIYKCHHLQHPSYWHLIWMYCGYYPFLLGWITMFWWSSSALFLVKSIKSRKI